MVWFKVDDSFHSHPKQMATSLAAVGLWSVAGSWSSDHLTDGFVPDHMIPSLSRGQAELAKELCAAGLWRRTRGGYQFHQWHADDDGTVRNPSRDDVQSVRQKRAEAGRKGGLVSGKKRSKASSKSEALASPIVRESFNPRPVPSRRDGGSLREESSGGQSVRAGAREHQAIRHLHARYGLTDDEADQVIAEVRARALAPITYLTAYLDGMTEGDLADIVKAAMDAGQLQEPPPPVVDDTPVELRHRYRDDRGSCGDCGLPAENRRHQEAS
jgi:hypothetical protein